MALYGTLHTMPLPELLTWVHSNKKTGALELERNQICKRVQFADGHVVACSSDDPGARFGQYLLSHGKITEDQLSQALSRQRSSGKNLGSILKEMGALDDEEERRQLAHKAEENIYSLFDWPDAVFRFREDVARDPYGIDVDVSIEDVIFKGMQRREELNNIREVFDSSGLVLRRTLKQVPTNVRNSGRAMRILELVDGERTLAELLLHAHSTEHTVVKFLFTLYRMGVVEISGARPVPGEQTSILDNVVVQDPEQCAESRVTAPREDPLFSLDLQGEDEDVAGPSLDAVPLLDGVKAVDEDSQAAAEPPRPPAGLEQGIQMLNEGRYADALDLLAGCYKQRPNDDSLRQIMLRAEGAYLQDIRNRELRGYRVPVATLPGDISHLSLGPTELFLLNAIDGKKDIQSILWVTPQRELDLMRALDNLRKKGLIVLSEPAPEDVAVRVDEDPVETQFLEDLSTHEPW